MQTAEADLWKHLRVCDMSEESDDDGGLLVHKPSYRSAGK